jgi:hypothetical protein
MRVIDSCNFQDRGMGLEPKNCVQKSLHLLHKNRHIDVRSDCPWKLTSALCTIKHEQLIVVGSAYVGFVILCHGPITTPANFAIECSEKYRRRKSQTQTSSALHSSQLRERKNGICNLLVHKRTGRVFLGDCLIRMCK